MLPNEMKTIILSLSKLYFNSTKTKNYKDSKKLYPKKITKDILYDLLSTMSDDDDSKNTHSNKIHFMSLDKQK